jgi:hypothetical protein
LRIGCDGFRIADFRLGIGSGKWRVHGVASDLRRERSSRMVGTCVQYPVL